jgi:hypothetical protein
MTTQVIDSMKEQFMFTTKSVKSSNRRADVDKSKDIEAMVKSIRSKGPVCSISWDSFSKFKDPIHRIDVPKLHNWVNEQKEIAAVYM